MKILIIMGGFFPGKKYGGPPVSVDNFCSLMKNDECYIVTTNHDMGEKIVYSNIKKGWNDRGNCKVLYLSDKEYSYKNYEKTVNEIVPDIIYLQGLFQSCIIPSLALAKKKKMKVILAPRGELCKGAFKKKYKKIPYIIFLKIFGLIKNIHFQSTCIEETEAIKKYLSVKQDKIHFLNNIPTLPFKEYAKKMKEPGKAKFIFLSRIVPKKNLLGAIEFFNEIKGEIEFDIYGSIEDEIYWEKCKQKIEYLSKNIKVKYCGLVSHECVQETFAKYDAFIFPTFSENFGHVIAEALSVGCPIIISDQTPWTDVNNYKAGCAYSLNDTKKFKKYIQKIVNMNVQEAEEMTNNVQKYFGKAMNIESIQKQYEIIFKK